MPADPSSLYGVRAPKTKIKEISSSTTLAFTSQLTSLLASSSSSKDNRASSGRPRPAKPDLFTSHNRNAKNRAAKDLQDRDDPSGESRARSQDLGAVDSSTLHRSKRRLEEKARLYGAMKRGDYVASKAYGDRHGDSSLVDFDRKWAEGRDAAASDLSSSEDEVDNSREPGDEEIVDYQDEFGRTRRITLYEARKLQRARENALLGRQELEKMSLRPAAPATVLRGDVVQAAAFNPDEDVSAKMEELARKRDRSLTPPPETHYDASKEIRTKGVGFYAFSGGKEEREREMEGLGRQREETERRRKERLEKVEKRRKEVEDRRREVGAKRAKREAESFLDGLEDNVKGAAGQQEREEAD